MKIVVLLLSLIHFSKGISKEFVCPEGITKNITDPQNCARYFQCIDGTLIKDEFHCTRCPKPILLKATTCPYPDLYSEENGDCQPYKTVQCGSRYEPKAPCEYSTEGFYPGQCQGLRPSCRGMPDGHNPHPFRKWSIYFIRCERERTVSFNLKCGHDRRFFSPVQRKCVTLWEVPKQFGGRMPDCTNKSDGYYPDEYGRCPFYFECRDKQFVKMSRCDQYSLFSQLTRRCESGHLVPAPCGGGGDPDCKQKDDGLYRHTDPGYCPFYYHCAGETVKGIFQCKRGNFNPLLGRCGSPKKVPLPCGYLPNLCKDKKDGHYKDTKSVYGGHGYYVCQNKVVAGYKLDINKL